MADGSNAAAYLTADDVCDIVGNKCEKDVSNDRTELAFIIAVYIVVFFVWGVYALFDFINDRWKRLESIYGTGKFQLVCFFVTMPVALFYIMRLAKVKDYTEMCTAIVALVFYLYHFSRTVWGMIQLVILRRWVRLALQTMHFQGYHLCADAMLEHSDEKFARTLVKHRQYLTDGDGAYQSKKLTGQLILFIVKLPPVTLYRSKGAAILQKVINHHVNNLLVNNSIVDNEFVEMENPFYLNGMFFFDESEPLVFPSYPDQCFLRWSVLYLAYYGVPFLQDSNYCRSLVYDLECAFVPNYFIKCLLTQAMLIGNTDAEQSPDQQITWESTWATIVLCRTEALFASLQDSSSMPLGKMDMEIQRGLYFERFTHRLSRLVDNVPVERVDLKSNHQGSNSIGVGLVRGISHRDVENFAIFLHSKLLHSVDTSNRVPTARVDRFSVLSLQFFQVCFREFATWIDHRYGSGPWGRMLDRAHGSDCRFGFRFQVCAPDRAHDVENPEATANRESSGPEFDPLKPAVEKKSWWKLIFSKFASLFKASSWTRRSMIYTEFLYISEKPVKYTFDNKYEKFPTKDFHTAGDSAKVAASGVSMKRLSRPQYGQHTSHGFRGSPSQPPSSQGFKVPLSAGSSFSAIGTSESEQQIPPVRAPTVEKRSHTFPIANRRPFRAPATGKRSCTFPISNSSRPVAVGSREEAAIDTHVASTESTELSVQESNLTIPREDDGASVVSEELTPFSTNEQSTAQSSQTNFQHRSGSQSFNDRSGEESGQQRPPVRAPSVVKRSLAFPIGNRRPFQDPAIEKRPCTFPIANSIHPVAVESREEVVKNDEPIPQTQLKLLLQKQLCIKEEEWNKYNISSLPTFQRCSNNLKSVQWNSRVPIVSVIIDNIYAIVSGNQYCTLLCKSNVDSQESDVLSSKINSHIAKKSRRNMLQEANLIVQQSVIKTGLVGSDSSGIRGFQQLQFLGASMRDIPKTGNSDYANVESSGFAGYDKFFLYRFVRRTGFLNLIDPSQDIYFPVSRMLRDAARILVFKSDPLSKLERKDGIGERYALESRMIWECQQFLHTNFPQVQIGGQRKRPHLHFALLIVLSFPTLATRITSQGKNLSLSVEPLLAPQAVAVNIEFNRNFSHIQMKFAAPKRHAFLLRLNRASKHLHDEQLILKVGSKKDTLESFKFQWEDWITAFQGRMRAFKPDHWGFHSFSGFELPQ